MSLWSQLDKPDDIPEYKSDLRTLTDANQQQRIKQDQQLKLKRENMKTLFDQIEGLSKLLPAKNDRFVVRDGLKSRFWEVNAQRFKSNEMVHIYVLSDALLVTSWKKNVITGKAKMTVDRVWDITEIGIVDVKDSPGNPCAL